MHSPSDFFLCISLKFFKICVKKLLHDVDFYNLSVTTEKTGMLNSHIPERNLIVKIGRWAGCALVILGWRKGELLRL